MKAPQQALGILDNNQDIHSHACGEYVLEQLQKGVGVQDVVDGLLSQYLVETTRQRVAAYRYYREQRGEYWTTKRLELLHWAYLYQQVSLEKTLARPKLRRQVLLDVISVRDSLCQHLSLAEELVPPSSISKFFVEHEQHAKLPLLYPRAKVFKDVVPQHIVDFYMTTLRGWDSFRGLAAYQTAHKAMGESYFLADKVASEHKCIVLPRQSADACLVAAYSMLKCEEIFTRQSWYRPDCLAAGLLRLFLEVPQNYACNYFVRVGRGPPGWGAS